MCNIHNNDDKVHLPEKDMKHKKLFQQILWIFVVSLIILHAAY